IRQAWNDLYGMAGSYNNTGVVYIARGDFEQAIEQLEQALVIGRRINYIDVLAITTGNLARCYFELGRYEAGLDLVRQGLAVARENERPLQALGLQKILGRALREHGELDEAEVVLFEARADAEASGMTVALLETRGELGALAWERGDFQWAATELADIIAAVREVRNPHLLWELQLYHGRARRDLGDHEAAVAVFRESVTTLEQLRSSITDEEAAGQYQSSHGEVYRELVDLLVSLGRQQEAWEVLGLMKSQELRDLDTRQGALRPDTGTGEREQVQAHVDSLFSREAVLVRRLRQELNKPVAQQRPELIREWQKAINTWKLRFQDFVDRLDDKYEDLHRRLEVQPPSFHQLQRSLRADEAFCEPLILPDRIILFVVRGGGEDVLIYREVLVDEQRVRDLIGEMRTSLENPGVAWEQRRTSLATARPVAEPVDPTEPARALYELLIAPILGDLAGIETLIVSPSGRLRYVPFAALFDGEQYLIDRFRVSVLTMAGALTPRQPLTAAASLLAIGNPDSSLDGAKWEVEQLELLWQPGPVTVIIGDGTTKERLQTDLPGHSILHLATHGHLNDQQPEASYIKLAGEGKAGELTFREITLLPLLDVDLAVLSACKTAVGENSEGTEIAGLAYKFEQNGAAAVIASLWEVSDRSTALLMIDLYESLRQGGVDKVEALRSAQLAMRQSEKYSHPYYWAPFILIGNWR
ncbi:MAG: CHAT domain-containing protein, partial [bacterium]